MHPLTNQVYATTLEQAINDADAITAEFVIGLKSDDKKVETLRQLIAMGNTYRCTVIVEGVETADSAHLLTFANT